MKPNQVFLAIGLAIPVVTVLLGLTEPTDNDPWDYLIVAPIVLSLTVTPGSIFGYFAGYAVKKRGHQVLLGLLAVGFYLGWFVLNILLEFWGFTPLSVPVFLLLWFLPPALTAASGLGLAHLEVTNQIGTEVSTT